MSSWCIIYMWDEGCIYVGMYVVLVRTCGGMVCVVLVCTEGCMSSWCVHVERGVCRLGAYMWGDGVCRLGVYRGVHVILVRTCGEGCMSSWCVHVGEGCMSS